ncbi:MAG TPA: hypothetical protein VE641_01295 [Chthoniobacterales bacterium]|jgi:hypothetical protein|nr:hypothetical protein [Chthoniobacterales bacterium]
MPSRLENSTPTAAKECGMRSADLELWSDDIPFTGGQVQSRTTIDYCSFRREAHTTQPNRE